MTADEARKYKAIRAAAEAQRQETEKPPKGLGSGLA